MSTIAPPTIVSVNGTAKPLIEQRVEFKCVLFVDGSTWCQPDAPEWMPDALGRIARGRKK